MWVHFAEAVYSAMTLFVLPLLLLAAMAGAEVLLDRTLRIWSATCSSRERNQGKSHGL
jgi:hypothetical protein